MHTNWCVLIEILMEIGMLNFWLGILVTAQTKENYFNYCDNVTLFFYVINFHLLFFSDNWLDCLYATFMAICITDIYVGTSVSWTSNICPMVWWKPTRLWALYISHGTLYLSSVNPRSNLVRRLASTRMATIVTKTTRMG